MRIKVKKARVATVKQLRVCAYIRVSSATDETEDSFDTQRQHFIEHIGANPEWIYAGVYADFGISGFFKERPGFQSMMADARAGKFDLVLVKSVSRFARNTETFLNATRELKRLGIGVYFELQQINSLTQAGELMLTIKAAFAQGESDSSSELMKMTYRRKFSQGIATPFSAKTYGFKPGEDKSICVDEPRARIVRFIFDMADMGIWHTKIADELNKQHIPAPEGKAWNGCQISRMIRNVMYKGDLLLQKNFRDAQHKNHKNRGEVQRWYIKENHPAIVSSKLWERVQLSEREPVHSTDIPPVGGRSSHQRYPLTGKLFCPYCGAVMHHKWCNSGKAEYWVCSTNIKKKASSCKGLFLPAKETNGWNVTEPMVVVPYKDKYGMPHFTAYMKEEYDAMKGDVK